MADRRKLAQGLMMMTPAMREDLAGREQDIQRGKTAELLRRASKEMYENPIVNTAIGFTPGVGDVQAAGETFSALQRGAPWQETAGYAVGMLPFVPMIGKTTLTGSSLDDALDVAERIKKIGPEYIPKIEQAQGGSVYLTVDKAQLTKSGNLSKNKYPVDFKARFADHPSYWGSTISSDPFTGNEPSTVFDMFMHKIGKAEEPNYSRARFSPADKYGTIEDIKFVEGLSHRGNPVIKKTMESRPFTFIDTTVNDFERNGQPIAQALRNYEAPKPSFDVTKQDASDIFGEGASRIRYQDPNTQGFIDVLQRPDGTASVLGLEVPEAARGQGVGQSLQQQVLSDFPEMQGQVSSKAAATTAHRLGRRPVGNPEATLDDVFRMIDEDSSVNLVSPEMQKRFNFGG